MKSAQDIKNKRLGMGLTQLEFSQLLGLGEAGERTVRGWENGEHIPSKSKLSEINSLPNYAPFAKHKKNPLFTFPS